MFKFLEVKSNKSKKKEIITLNMITNFLKPFKLKKFKVVKICIYGNQIIKIVK